MRRCPPVGCLWSTYVFTENTPAAADTQAYPRQSLGITQDYNRIP
nr:MAG TPA: hypothetical protein [Bacteriophage sp.]